MSIKYISVDWNIGVRECTTEMLYGTKATKLCQLCLNLLISYNDLFRNSLSVLIKIYLCDLRENTCRKYNIGVGKQLMIV